VLSGEQWTRSAAQGARRSAGGQRGKTNSRVTSCGVAQKKEKVYRTPRLGAQHVKGTLETKTDIVAKKGKERGNGHSKKQIPEGEGEERSYNSTDMNSL